MLCFFTTLAIGLPPLDMYCALIGCGRNSRARTWSVGAVSAVNVEDVTRDEPAFVRTEEYDAVGDLLGEDEPTERNLRHQGRLVLRRAGEAGQHAGVRGAGRDGVHPNPRLGELERHRLGNAFDGVLGADV